MPAAPAIIGAVGAIGGGLLQSRGASQAADAQVQSSREAIDLQRGIYNQTRQDFEPFRQNALNATNLYNALLGIPQIDANQQAQPLQANAAPAESGGGGRSLSDWNNIIDPLGPFGPLHSSLFKSGSKSAPTHKDINFQTPDYDPNSPSNIPSFQGGMLTPNYDPSLPGNSRDMEWRQLVTNDPNQNTFRPAGSSQLSATPRAQTTEQLQQQAIDAFRNLPGYQENLNQQQQMVDRSAAARGNSLSGRALLESQSRASNYADNSFNNYLNRIGASAGQAVPITSQMGQYGQNFAGSAGNALMNSGNARASGYINQANAGANTLNSLGQIGGYFFGGQG